MSLTTYKRAGLKGKLLAQETEERKGEKAIYGKSKVKVEKKKRKK